MGQKDEASLAFFFGREYKITYLFFAMFTHFKSLQFNQANNISIYHSSNSSHKIIETKQCMQACQTLFYLQKWFIIGYKHYKTLIGHFIKWQIYLQKILPLNDF